MAAIDLYNCAPFELEQHLTDPALSLTALEGYAKEMARLIAQQKADDAAAASATSASKARRKTDDDNASIASSTSRTARNRRRKTRKRQHDSDEDDAEAMSVSVTQSQSNTTRDPSVEYSWMQGMADGAPSESSSDDPLLDHNLIDAIDGTDVDMLLSDAQTAKDKAHTTDADADAKRKRERKEKKKRKRDRKRKRKERHKKKKKKKKSSKDDDDFLISDDADDADADDADDSDSWDKKAYERRLKSWSMSQLEKEESAILRQIEHEKAKSDKKSKKKRTRSRKSVSLSSSESGEEDLNSLGIEGIISKIEDRVRTIKKDGAALQQQQQYEEDPSKLYCVCRQPYDGSGHMICCDYCQEWYHLSCIGLSAEKVKHLEHMRFKCPICNGGNVRDVLRDGATLSQSTFDSPKNSPNPRDPRETADADAIRKPKNRRRFIADSESGTDPGMQSASERAALQARKESVVDKQRCAKYEKVVVELQTRLKESKDKAKKQYKEMTERLAKAKADIDEERQRRVAVEAHMSGAKRNSEAMMGELNGKFEAQQQKEAELVAKLKKLESNKKKYKESASENKRKMRQLKEEHETRVNELENEIIPMLKEQVTEQKRIASEVQNKLHQVQQSAQQTQQQAQSTIAQYNTEFQKVQAELSRKSADAAKLHNLVSQLRHKMEALHAQAQQNHLQWERIDKSRQDKIAKLEQQLSAQGVVHGQNGSSQTPNGSSSATPRPPSPIKIPPTPAYLVFNDLELSELKMCRELCRKLLDANLFQVEHMAQRASLTRELFVCWVTGVGGPSPTVINDLKLNANGQRQTLNLDMSRHLSMNSIRLLLIEIRKQLEVIAAEGQAPESRHDETTLKKVNGLLRDFQSASTAYEARMNEFKHMQHQKLLEGCRQKGAALEMLCVVGSGENGEPKSEWVKVTVHSFDASANRVLVNKGPHGEMSYAAIDAATLRLPMASPDIMEVQHGAQQNIPGPVPVPVPAKVQPQMSSQTQQNRQGHGQGLAVMPNMQAQPVPVPVQPQPHWNMSLSRNSHSVGNNVMNLNGLPQIGVAAGVGVGVPYNGGVPGVLPPFNDLQANTMHNAHPGHSAHISNTINTINTNNNIRINGVAGGSGPTRTTIVIDGAENAGAAEGKKSKSKSRKRKRGGEDKGKKKKRSKSRSIKDDSSSDSESETESDSDLSSESFDSDEDDETRSASSRVSSKKSKKKKKRRKRKEKEKAKKKAKREKRASKKKAKVKSKGVKGSKGAEAKSASKKKGSKRALDSVIGGGSAVQPAKKRQKIGQGMAGVGGGGGEYVVVGRVKKDKDANDSVCRICKHPGDLVCCEGCPSVYHADCIRPRIPKKWLDAFEEWHCPSCAPRYHHVPLRKKVTGEKWPIEDEPLLCDLKDFLQKHPELEKDPQPDYHPSRKRK